MNFIEDIKTNNNCGLEEAIRIALKRVVGACVIVVLDKHQTDTHFIARPQRKPKVTGVGKGEHFLASDASPIIEYTKEVSLCE